MASRTTTFDYSEFALYVDGSELNGVIDKNLEINLELAETVAATPTVWQDYCKGLVDWMVTGSGGWIETAAECGVDSSLKFDGSNEFYGVQDMDFTINVAMSETSSQSTSGYRTYAPSIRTAVVNFSGMYYDPASSVGNWGSLYTCAAERTGSLSIVQAFGTGSSISFTGYPNKLVIGSRRGEHVKVSGTILATGAVTDGTAGQASIDALFTKLYAGTSVTALMLPDAADDTAYTGSAFVQSLGASIPMSGRIEYRFTLRGSGALTDYIVT